MVAMITNQVNQFKELSEDIKSDLNISKFNLEKIEQTVYM
mgnify:CR=1 FL=1|jgi:hypothetical protein